MTVPATWRRVAEEWHGVCLIEDVETWTCRFELPAPLPIGDGEITEREYVIARITTDTGHTGVAYALSRGAPVAAFLRQHLAPLVCGEDALLIPRIRDRLERALLLLGTDGIAERALSLLDICLWDIKAQVAGLPLWQLLGGARTEASTLLVDCYPRPQDQVEQVAASIAQRAEQGYRLMKIHCGEDPPWVSSLLTAACATAERPIEFVLDAGMAWRDPLEALEAIRVLAPHRPAWIEDPFRAEHVDWIRRIRDASPVPIGAGDEVASPLAIRRLIDSQAVDVVRLDATCHGGLSGFAELSARAARAGCRVSPHVYPEIHQHCVFAWPAVFHVEVFAGDTAVDAAESFVLEQSQVRVVDGRVAAPKRPGLGLELNWDAILDAAVL